MEHHEFAPSSLARLELCPGSYRLAKQAPKRESEDATEGTYLHACLAAEERPAELNEEQRDVLRQCEQYLHSQIPSGKYEHEARVSLLDGFEILTFGTADIIGETIDTVIGIDWKFGRVKVEVEDNLQFDAYAAALMQRHGKPCVFHVAQPRLRRWLMKRYELSELPKILKRVQSIINRAKNPLMVLNPCEEACRYCPAFEAVCPAANELVQENPLVKIEHTSELTAEQVAAILPLCKLVKKKAEAMLHRAKTILLEGGEIPGCSIKTSQGNRAFTDMQKVYEAIQDLVKFEDFMPLVSAPYGKLSELFVKAYREKCVLEGVKVTQKEALDKFNELTGEWIKRGSDRIELVINEDE